MMSPILIDPRTDETNHLKPGEGDEHVQAHQVDHRDTTLPVIFCTRDDYRNPNPDDPPVPRRLSSESCPLLPEAPEP